MNDETRLHEIAKRLGARAAERLDVERAARNVVERLRAGEQPARSPSWIHPAWLRIAATVVVLVGGTVVVSRVRSGDGHRGSVAHLVADDLRDLSPGELREVLAGFDQMLDSTAAPTGSADLNELDAQQLRAVLRSLEG